MAQSLSLDSPVAAPLRTRGLSALLATRDEVAPLVARLTLGLIMFPHGAQKLLGWFGGYGFAGTMGFFTGKMGLPVALASLAIFTEFFASLGLVSGLLSRLSALGIATMMLVAIATSHLQNGFFMNWNGNQKGEGFEYHLLVLGLSLIVLLRGGGAWSFDRFLTRSSRA